MHLTARDCLIQDLNGNASAFESIMKMKTRDRIPEEKTMIQNISLANPQLTNASEVKEFKKALDCKSEMEGLADKFAILDQSSVDINPTKGIVMLCDTHLDGIPGSFTGTANLTEQQEHPATQSLNASRTFVKHMPVDIMCYGDYCGTGSISFSNDGNITSYKTSERVPDFYTKETTLSINSTTGTITFDEQLKREMYYMGTGSFV